MNRFTILLTLIVLTTHCFGQDKFIIKELRGSFPNLSKNDVKASRSKLFEDSLYIVSKTCNGEWGGTIKFKNKKTGIVYSAASTCPVVVNKLNGKYYVTNTLAHLRGFSEVLEISNPDSMSVFELSNIVWNESKSTKGTKQLLDSIGVLILVSFPYNGQLYHVVANYEKTFLTKIENNKFVTIDTVSNTSLRSSNPAAFVLENGHFLVRFKNQNAKGYLDIFENQITVVQNR